MAVVSRPPFRAFLIGPDWQHLEVLVVRGLDRDVEVPFYHAFGPEHEPIPRGWRPMLAARDPDRPLAGRVHVEFETYRDPAGVTRFKPLYRLPHTNN